MFIFFIARSIKIRMHNSIPDANLPLQSQRSSSLITFLELTLQSRKFEFDGHYIFYSIDSIAASWRLNSQKCLVRACSNCACHCQSLFLVAMGWFLCLNIHIPSTIYQEEGIYWVEKVGCFYRDQVSP
ncbi:hypothetical protein MUK42_12546 [Musa troglodytarum]|uniref:Uncharacterized protein n=1 Tax=Musa troglodytarum TaxID=320322 RepID=A0A9E7GFT5_9LILI|nr:hypothetical protein MUK42_12546 [Musa troglodytarum]